MNHRGLYCNFVVFLLLYVIIVLIKVSTARICLTVKHHIRCLHRTEHNYLLLCNEGQDHVGICRVCNMVKTNSEAYCYKFILSSKASESPRA